MLATLWSGGEQRGHQIDAAVGVTGQQADAGWLPCQLLGCFSYVAVCLQHLPCRGDFAGRFSLAKQVS